MALTEIRVHDKVIVKFEGDYDRGLSVNLLNANRVLIASSRLNNDTIGYLADVLMHKTDGGSLSFRGQFRGFMTLILGGGAEKHITVEVVDADGTSSGVVRLADKVSERLLSQLTVRADIGIFSPEERQKRYELLYGNNKGVQGNK